ncbi:hypothetical protein PCASD_19005 [Puccinia coronata f. sp. avenae]|uniref:Uncharacterized protein n=1 Tax=Puccinia coronata f. sp. avenae TaxID=200324 RepID=A0A2N5SIV5_9BASI|nr:hypothetical protein PCASD_19005 [Puccinia coronata f. sp. avenae]
MLMRWSMPVLPRIRHGQLALRQSEFSEEKPTHPYPQGKAHLILISARLRLGYPKFTPQFRQLQSPVKLLRRWPLPEWQSHSRVGVDHRALVPVWTQPELGYVVYVHKLPDGGYAGIPQALREADLACPMKSNSTLAQFVGPKCLNSRQTFGDKRASKDKRVLLGRGISCSN